MSDLVMYAHLSIPNTCSSVSLPPVNTHDQSMTLAVRDWRVYTEGRACSRYGTAQVHGNV